MHVYREENSINRAYYFQVSVHNIARLELHSVYMCFFGALFLTASQRSIVRQSLFSEMLLPAVELFCGVANLQKLLFALDELTCYSFYEDSC